MSGGVHIPPAFFSRQEFQDKSFKTRASRQALQDKRFKTSASRQEFQNNITTTAKNNKKGASKMSIQILSPRIMEFGAGSSREIPHILAMLGCSKPLIVTDIVMVGLGYADSISQLLDNHRISHDVFADTVSDPTVESIMAGVRKTCAGTDSLFPDAFDSIIALGGGSSIDSAKAISILSQFGGKIQDYKLPRNVNEQGLPIIAVPTTGTGAEVTPCTIITDADAAEKMLCAGIGFSPVAVIIDSKFTRTVPSRIIADTGIDALTRAIESYVCQRANLYSDQQALAAMHLINRNIRQAYYEPENNKAREAMILGATLAGSAFSNTSGALIHGMSGTLSACFDVPHGMSNAMLLPTITEYSISAAPSRYATCARTMGVASQKDSDQAANAKLLNELKALNQELKVPRLSEYGINKASFFERCYSMAEQALASGAAGNNPRMPTKDEITELYEIVWQQK
ncbi:MAG: iron-containing alcohol dehydrogenase [Amphritea sp.]